jgi:FOG: TPR repeat
MKQNLQKRRLTTISHDLGCVFSLLFLTSILSAYTLPALGLTAEDQAEIRDLVNRGNGLMNAGRYKEALDEYDAVLRIDPENYYGKANRVLTHNKWALSLFRVNKYKEAKQHWDIAHQLNPNDATVNQNIKVLEFRLQKLGIDLDAEEKAKEDKAAAASGGPQVFDPLRESPNDWSPFPRQAKPQANSAQTPQRPTGGAFNVGGGMPPAQQAQQAPPQQVSAPRQVTQSGPQLMGGVSGSPSQASNGPMVVSGGTTSSVPSSGPVMLNGSASGGPAAVSGPESTGEPGAVSNYGGTFTLSAGTSNSESPEDDYSAVKIVGGAPAGGQGASEAHEGLPFTESNPAPGNASNPANVPASGYTGNAGAYEAASNTAQGQALASNQGVPPGNQGAPVGNQGAPAGNASSPYGNATGASPAQPRSYITGQQAYGGTQVNSYPLNNNSPMNNSPPANNYSANNYQTNSYQPNKYQQNSTPPGGAAAPFQPAGNVNMSFSTTGNVVIPPPATRHGEGSAYKFPTNIVPPRAAPDFLGEAPPSTQSSTPSPSYSDSSSTSAPQSSESHAEESTNTPSRSAAAETSSDNSAATVNKILTEIEKKVYGKTSENLPILKRLERIEVDTLGHKVTGSINDRLNKMKETYGL